MKTKNNVLVFILIAFGFSWLFWVPEALIAQNIWNAPDGVRNVLALNLGAWGPLIGAFLTTLIYQRGAGVRELLKRGLMVGLGKWWWVVLFIFPVLIGAALGISVLLGNPSPVFEVLQKPAELPVALVFIFFLGGPLQEEFGWRGYVLDPLQSKYSALISSIVIGFFWGIWHLPLFFINGTYQQNLSLFSIEFWMFFIFILPHSIIFTLIFNNTNRSILSAMLFHFCVNFFGQLFSFDVHPSNEKYFSLRALGVFAVNLLYFSLYQLIYHNFSVF